VDAARRSDVAIVFAGLSDRYETEGYDRDSFGLPPGQDELIQAVLKANPRTVVVPNAGSPVDMGAWVRRVSALLLAWYSGVEAGTAPRWPRSMSVPCARAWNGLSRN
jgi:beta-glucosidase